MGIRPGAAAMAQATPPRTRRIWLRMLLDQVDEHIQAGKALTDEQQHFAGLMRVKFVFVDDKQRDVILEGPAEDRWEARPDGIVIGSTTKQPVLQLADFAIAWRNANDGSPAPSLSLEQQQESIERIQNFTRATKRPTNAAGREAYGRQLQEAWGPQDVVSTGVPFQSRFNKVMADADWEMKRISLGITESGVEPLKPYVDLEFADWRRRVEADGLAARRPDGGSRFWFYPANAEFPRSEKFDAVAIPDDSVQLLTESHFRRAAQQREIAQQPSPAAKQFADSFTKHFAAVSDKSAIYADLRNLFDWVALSRLLLLLEVPRRIGTDFPVLRNKVPVPNADVPKTMAGLAVVRHAEVDVKEGTAALFQPAWGGVSIDVAKSVRPETLRVDRSLEPRAAAAHAERPRRSSKWWQPV